MDDYIKYFVMLVRTKAVSVLIQKYWTIVNSTSSLPRTLHDDV